MIAVPIAEQIAAASNQWSFSVIDVSVLGVSMCLVLLSHQTICSVNSEVVSKFDAAKVIRFSRIKLSSHVHNGSSHFGTIPLFFLGVQSG